ncbi:ABC transporter permease [Aminobacter sp. Piv2-1]|uniref:ABC transporter permease n=1 Tax=Aminobacter sp. Piv2-1 TaxID=3031122 RepID=UPI0030B321BC
MTGSPALTQQTRFATWYGHRGLAIGLLPIVAIALFVLLSIVEPKFLRAGNLINVLRNASFLMLVATGQMLVLIIGGFDLAVGAVVAFASVAAALSMAALLIVMPDSPLLVIALGGAAGIVAGAAVGLMNGLVTALMKVNPFMVTLGTLSIASGLALYLTQGVPIYGMPELFTRDFAKWHFLNLPAIIYFTAFVLIVMWWLMNWTRYGRYVYAIGSNPHAARVSGVPVNLIVISTYTACGAFAALAGVLLTARVGSGEATLGGNMMMESIAAAVIGGVSLRGGVGRVEMVALGSLFLALVNNGLNLMRIDSKLQAIVVGVVLILAVGIDRLQSRRARR